MFDADSQDCVCRACGQKHAPSLVALLDLAGTAERVGRIGRHSVFPPLGALLDLARAQKVDLAKISILSLVEQYLAVIEGARRIRLELAADWLVMAAWLTWLKSRLLLPAASGDDLESGELAAEALAEHFGPRVKAFDWRERGRRSRKAAVLAPCASASRPGRAKARKL